MILSAALIKNYLTIDGTTIDTLKDKINEIREHFPCGWLHVEKSLSEVINEALFFIDKDFKKPVIWDFGVLTFTPKDGFVLNAKGRHAALWS
jgi:hypothetical protein